MILGIISFLVFIGAVACFVQKEMATGMVALLLAFLISPYGLPKIADSVSDIINRNKRNKEEWNGYNRSY